MNEQLESSKSTSQLKIKRLRVFPFLNSGSVIHELKQNYLSILLQVTMLPQLSTEKDGGKEILTYCLAGQMLASVLLIQPSSAAAECCFSILSNSLKETSVMLQYNSRDHTVTHVLVSFA